MNKGYNRGADRQPLLSNEFTPGQVQNAKAARIYVFGKDEVVDDEEEYELEMSEIRSRRGGSQTNHPNSQNEDSYFEKELCSEDTLQKLALQYSCPVYELKRLNNLIQDQDFYALRYIKVPINKFGFVSEIIEQEKKQTAQSKYSSRINGAAGGFDDDDNGTYEDPESSHDFSDPETQMKIIHKLSIRDNLTPQSREAEDFLRSMDRDLKRVMKTRSDRNSLDEVISVLTNKTFTPLERNRSVKLYGADCGMSYWKVVALIIVVGLILPAVFGYLYFYEPWKS